MRRGDLDDVSYISFGLTLSFTIYLRTAIGNIDDAGNLKQRIRAVSTIRLTWSMFLGIPKDGKKDNILEYMECS
ncbi:hypothetical protein EYC80_002387 [Monilinia laxa]|uniref:Uncharacterized protein n=1 Tax=Monilinia laxa TaxID=61186 RepID=A0A5N6K4C6_MONLA|nr:hypothetical protein EYC80_002387 [Monilinia laxa]